jgi:poly(A) polymerase Pap1
MPNQSSSPGRTKSNRNKPRSRRNKKGAPASSTSSTSSSSSSCDGGGRSPLEQTLLEVGCFETDNSHRQMTVDYIEKILARWALTLSSLSTNSNYNSISTSGNSNNPWQRPRVALIPFGSYRLGVHRPDSDLDLLALAPPCCTRHDYFTSLVQLFTEDSEISHVHPIGSAYTPNQVCLQKLPN